MNEGDIYITNDPWLGTGHLNDFVLTTPCFRKGELVALLEEEAKEQGGGSGPAPKSIKQAPKGGTVNRTRM